jgi:hypothetical protein
MQKPFQVILSLALMLSLMGCRSSDSGSHSNSFPEKAWTGPENGIIFSSDIEHCGKSAIAKKLDLPGFIRINWPDDGSAIYHSTAKLIQFNSELVDSGYRLGDLSLWKKPETNDQVYVGIFEGNNPPKEVVVYELGGCE